MMGNSQSDACRRSFDKLRSGLRKNLKEITKATLGYQRIPKNDAVFDAGVFLLSALMQTGPHTGPISRMTGIPRRTCALWGVKARELAILDRIGVYADPWMDDDELKAAVNFGLDASVVSGELVCEGPRGDGRLYDVPKTGARK